ncbi:NAD(P)-dependent oxidoreductase [Azospirillum sp. TSO22-1]|uniref:NAD-dependent epimerase/dehydratase family protein n=1 Tax=Azospirillum sp. TSO22-1 TaxID=716789 RepID=UPI000D60996F|nr:NAD(P)-dependent oxidoreductase [Azospirillum sp. TSO22-1]PWC38795.1 NAD-dependent epimerase [Azospirillum sp. TSO22-1]
MKVLLTGARGYLGRYVARQLHEAGVPFVAAGRTRPPVGDFLPADLLDTGRLDELVTAAGATHLVHLAWYVEHGAFWTAPVNADWANAGARLAEAFCRAGGQHVTMAGTCAEYRWDGTLCREDETPIEPATVYGQAKDACRRMAQQACAQHGVPLAWARIFLPYGPGEDARRLVPSLVAALSCRQPPFPVNAQAQRDFLYVDDAASALLQLSRCAAGGAFNISSGQPVAIGDVVRELARILGADPEPILALAAPRPGEPMLLAGDNHKLRALGWTMKTTLAEGLARAARHADTA